MEIKSIYSQYAIKPEKYTGKSNDASGGTPAIGKENNSVDMIELSPNATLQTQLAVEKKAAARSFHAELSDARVAALRLKYQGDNCPVSGSDVAEAMMKRVLGQEE